MSSTRAPERAPRAVPAAVRAPAPALSPVFAAAYRETERLTGWYAGLAADLVAFAAPQNESLVVELCCGTGVSTRALVAGLPEHAELVAIDAAPAMLAVAAAEQRDERIRWHRAQLPEVPSGLRADLVFCSAGLPGISLPALFRAARAVSSAAGRLVFNAPPGVPEFAALEPTARRPDALEPDPTGLLGAMRRIAQQMIGDLPLPTHRGSTQPPSGDLYATAARFGWVVEDVRSRRYAMSHRDMARWLSLPEFLPAYPPLSLAQCREVLARAVREVDPDRMATATWQLVRARRAPSIGGLDPHQAHERWAEETQERG